MKRSKKIIALMVVFAVICAATFAVTQYEEKQEEIKNSDAIILTLPVDSVERVSWEGTENALAFHRGENGWLYDEEEAFPVSEEKITTILSHFEEFGVSFLIENVEDYGQYGLEEPEGVIHLGTADKSYDIKLGDFSTMDGKRYVDIGDGNVYLVNEDPMDFLESTLSAMMEHDETPVWNTVQDMTFSGSENYTVVRKEDGMATYSDEDIYFAQLGGRELPLDTDTVTDYLDTISGLRLRNYVTYDVTEEELSAFGLDTPALTVTVTDTETDDTETTDSRTFVLHMGQNAEERAAYEAAQAAGDDLPEVSSYVRIGDSPIVYALERADYLTLTGVAYNDLRHREVIWADAERVTQMEITLEGETHTLTSAEDSEGEFHWYYETEEVEIEPLQSALYALSADDFTEELPSEKEEIQLTVSLDNDDIPQVTIQLYRYDGSLCLAVVDGESVSLVDRAAVIQLVEAVQSIVLR